MYICMQNSKKNLCFFTRHFFYTGFRYSPNRCLMSVTNVQTFRYASLVLIFFSQCNMSLSLSLSILCSDVFPSTRVHCLLYCLFCSCIRVAVCIPMFFHISVKIYVFSLDLNGNTAST